MTETYLERKKRLLSALKQTRDQQIQNRKAARTIQRPQPRPKPQPPQSKLQQSKNIDGLTDQQKKLEEIRKRRVETRQRALVGINNKNQKVRRTGCKSCMKGGMLL